ncbi:helix-turn-helix domain-containing protein [Streptomyces sp. NPDC058369]|uniref:AraC-like ligand-binding domain-containing protein n=1 Tax=unclassified Streptomyces TaxID=2593676 RepID=UPI002255CDD4|nr:helix-turn-helix domain-containing protein [Streptomyces sp. NBC_01789]MCX4445863.1 helix-turn-helix domain-containing protein [Streptomyces sp. NBC_01789]
MWHEMAAAEMAPDNRFEWFEQVVSDVLLPTEFRAADPGGFDARGGMLDLGAAQLARFSYAPLSSRRTPALIREGDPEQYQLGLVTSGTAWFAQQGGEAELGVGGMALWDTSKPYESGSGMDGSDVEVVVLQIPKARMPLPSQRVDRLLARRIPGTAGFAAILAGFLGNLATTGPDCSPRQLDMLGEMAVDLTASCLAGRLGSSVEPPAELRSHVLLRRVSAFIDHHIADPDLTPGLIAGRHHLSLRSLHALFHDEPEGVAATIRRRRLEGCRADLARPALRRQSIQAVAARWGFTSATAFSRTFRTAYGVTPRDYRADALRRADGGL